MHLVGMEEGAGLDRDQAVLWVQVGCPPPGVGGCGSSGCVGAGGLLWPWVHL